MKPFGVEVGPDKFTWRVLKVIGSLPPQLRLDG